jgi:predicted esterase
MSHTVVSTLLLLSVGMVACTAAVDAPPRADVPPPAAEQDDRGSASTPAAPGATDPSAPAGPAAGVDDPGPAPSGACSIAKGQFVTRSSGESSYVAYVPKSYNGSPTRLLVALHGCGDDAQNFAEWAGAPYATRDDQTHITISVDGASGGGGCWSIQRDTSKVLAAIDDVAKCVYVHRQKIVVGGFSSGGMLAYSVGMKNADRFAGILIENSALSSAGNADGLLAGAARKIPVAHVAHVQDSVFPIGKVRGDWSKMKAAGFPLMSEELPGDHDGTTEDWAETLIPQMAGWQRP